MGPRWSSIKHIKDPYMFDWELRVALHAMQGYRVSSLPEGEVSWFFSSCSEKLGYILELRRGWPLKTQVFSGRLNRAFRDPLHLKQKNTRSISHTYSCGKLLLSCLWKVCLSLQLKTGNQLSSPQDMVCIELSSSCFTEIDVPLDLRWVSQGITGVS